MSCPDLCTAQKCRELEARIGALEQALELLEASFEAHTQQDIPTAHEYNPNLRVDVRLLGSELGVGVYLDDRYDFESVQLPEYEPFVTFDIFNQDDGSYVFKVQIDGQSDEDTLTLPEPPESNLRLDGSFQSDILTLTVADGESSDTATIPIPLPEIPEPDTNNNNDDSDLSASGSFSNDTLTVTITHGNSSDTFQVNIPTNTAPQTIFITEEVYMNCDELERKINDCCQQILDEISNSQNIIVAEIETSENNLKNEIDSAQIKLGNDIQTVEDYVTVDVSGIVQTGTCKLPVDDDGNILPEKNTTELIENNYSGRGIEGLHNVLQLIENKLTAILENSCAAIEPDLEVDLRDFARHCSIEVPTREEFSSDSSWFEAVKTAITGFGAGATLKVLSRALNFTPGSPVTFAVTATASYIYKHLLDQTFNQEAIAYNDLCQKIEEIEPQDVVSIVASPKYVTNIKGKILVLHFVTLDNYPKRSANSSYRPIQIPAAKKGYDWCEDFFNLRWLSGNQYGEMKLAGYRAKVSGWFASVDAGNEYFNAVLNLTTASEVNRSFPRHSNPRTSIVPTTWRPYRAFIESVDSGGRAICHAKYVPVPDDECSTL